MNNLDKAYWDERYDNNMTGWDVGDVTRPLKAYFDQITEKERCILIPGAGNAYEAEYLARKGFKNVHVLDISDRAINLAMERIPVLPVGNFHNEDFFDHQGYYDLIVEHTFFCALPRHFRLEYVRKAGELLKPDGQLVGLLWAKEFEGSGPPFGGSIEEYRELFGETFEIEKMELAYNSIKPRAGREMFVNFRKK